MQSAATTGLPRSVFDLRHRRLQQKTSAHTPVKSSLFAITHDVHGECPRGDGLFLSDFRSSPSVSAKRNTSQLAGVSFWRRHPDLNRGSRICSPMPYHLAMAPKNGAGNEIRTRYLHLGKVALCQMSYARKWCLRPELNWRHADFQSAALPTELPRQMACFERRDMVGTTGLEPVTPCL